MDIMYTVTEDSEEDVEEFSWDYSADVNFEKCKWFILIGGWNTIYEKSFSYYI